MHYAFRRREKSGPTLPGRVAPSSLRDGAWVKMGGRGSRWAAGSDLGRLGLSRCGAPEPASTLLLRAGSGVREGAYAGALDVLPLRRASSGRDGASGALLRRASSRVQGVCAAWKRRPKIFHASRELCCITLTSS